ncbi:MAG TPA: ABC transporter permease [Planctomycetota bacterium]|nr:ABC transporter permease [Planctomycetota bacterium]
MNDLLRASFALAAKDLRLFLRDKGGLALGFLLPIALITVMALVFGNMYGGKTPPKPEVKVLDLDRSPASRALVDVLTKQAVVRVAIDEGDKAAATRDELAQRVKNGKDDVALVIGGGYGAALDGGGAPPLELIREYVREMEGRIAEQALMAALMESSGGKIGRMMAGRGVDALSEEIGLSPLSKGVLRRMADGFFDRLDQEATAVEAAPASAPTAESGGGAAASPAPGGFMAGEMGAAFGLKTTVVGGESFDKASRGRIIGVTQSVAGTSVMMLLFGLVACGSTLLREREEGTLRRLLAAPVPRRAVLIGKFLYTMVVGLLQLIVMFLFGRLAFGLPVERDPVGLLLVGAATAAAATGFGVCIAVLCRTAKQVEGVSTLVVLIMSAIGGSWFPTMFLPEWMQKVSKITLTAWAMDGFHSVLWRDTGLAGAALPIAVLFGVGLALLVVASVLYERRFVRAA